jgi:hypothetical protein
MQPWYHRRIPPGRPEDEAMTARHFVPDVIVALMLTVAPRPAAAADPPTDLGPRVRVLITQLDDDQYRKREKATTELQRLGRAVVPELRAALQRPTSAEARRRLELLLDWYRVRLEWYTDRAEFVKRLAGRVREVTFDDLDTTKDDFVSFPANHYEKTHGIVITGQGGQYAGRTFGFPNDFRPASKPNTYAPGPVAKRDAPPGRRGGNGTDVTFSVGGKPAAVAGFAAAFIDADYPDVAPSSLGPQDGHDKLLGEPPIVRGADGKAVFCGVVAVDGSGRPVPVIYKVHLVNGGNWPSVEPGEGVTLDDFLYSDPVVPDKD